MRQRLASQGEPTWARSSRSLESGVLRLRRWSASDLWRSHAAHAHAARLARRVPAGSMGLSAPYAASFTAPAIPISGAVGAWPDSVPETLTGPETASLPAHVPSVCICPLPVLLVALAGVAGPLRVGGCWFRTTRCALRLLAAQGLVGGRGGWVVGFRTTRCAWGSFLVLLVALAGVAGPWRVGGCWLGPLGAHCVSLAARGPVTGRDWMV